jgi:transcriptional regulator with XRE-family HTH domain
MAIKDKIKEQRKKNGWTQDQLAEKVNVNGRSIGRYEIGGVEPSASILRKLADIFDVSVDYLLYDEAEEKISNKITDKELLTRFEKLNNINGNEKELLIGVLDLFIRDYQIKETYLEK